MIRNFELNTYSAEFREFFRCNKKGIMSVLLKPHCVFTIVFETSLTLLWGIQLMKIISLIIELLKPKSKFNKYSENTA